jgi:steroid 5-alpha reductase family enzyme
VTVDKVTVLVSGKLIFSFKADQQHMTEKRMPENKGVLFTSGLFAPPSLHTP